LLPTNFQVTTWEWIGTIPALSAREEGKSSRPKGQVASRSGRNRRLRVFSATLCIRMRSKPKNSIEAVLFDWDGTLLDSYDADSAAYLAAFREMGIPFTLEDLEQHYSPNGYAVYRAAKLPRARWPDANKAWRAQYANHKPKLIGGVQRVLAHVSMRYRMGLVTSGDRDRVHRQLREFGLTRLFRARVCAEDTTQRKPHPAPLRLALRQMDLRPEASVYVGDSSHDLEMARRAGVKAIAVLGRFPTEKAIRAANPEILLESIVELPAALARLCR
jgi:HAD superfamily hydrolase (TIGR01549 family)